ncbi:MAG: glycosyltransferase [Thermovirgaceae bacterium]
MKILFCSEGFLIDGVASFNLYLSGALREAGHEVAVAGRWAGFKSFKDRHRQKGVGIIESIGLSPSGGGLPQKAAAFGPDIIISDSRRAFPLAMAVKERSGARLVTVFHDPVRDDNRRNRSLETIVASSDAWITAEEPIFEQMKALKPPFPARLIRRPITSMMETSPLPDRDPFRVLCLGRLSGYKAPGFRALLDNALPLKEIIPSLEITFIGGGDRLPLFKLTGMKANMRSGETFVRVLGTRPDPNPWIGWSTAVCAGATSAAEAALSNRPVLAFSGYWMGPLLPDSVSRAIDCHFGERDGAFLMRDRPDAAVSGLKKLYETWEPAQIRHQVNETRMLLSQAFDSKKIVRDFLDLFKSLR